MADNQANSNGSVRITNRELFDRIEQLERKVDVLLDRDTERRLRKIEKWSYAVPPAILTALASLVIAALRLT